MANFEANFESLISLKNLRGLTTEEALSHIGWLTDLSLDIRKVEGLKYAIKLAEELQDRHLMS